MIAQSAILGSLALLVAALLPAGPARRAAVGRGLGALGVLALLPGVPEPGALVAAVAGAGAVVVGTPLALVLASSLALRVALGAPIGTAPAASALAALGTVAAADALLLRWREVPHRRASPAPLLVTGALLVAVLATVDRGAVLAGSFLPAAAPPWIGPLLAAALLSGLGGGLLVAGASLTSEAPAARPVGRAGLVGAAALGILGALVTSVRVVLGGGAEGTGAHTVSVVLAAAGALAVALQEESLEGESPSPARSALSAKGAAAIALATLGAAGVSGWWREGTYATLVTREAASAALVGLAALVPTSATLVLRLALLLALLRVAVS